MNRLLTYLALAASASFAQNPNITAVQDGAANTPNVAQGSVFVVKGSNLSRTGYTEAPAPIYPPALDGISIRFTAVTGGVIVTAPLIYAFNQNGVNQLAAVLPSTAPLGPYDVQVQNTLGLSNSIRTQVVARKPGIVTIDGSGTGPAQATINGALILQRNSNLGMIGQFATRPARPGERIDLWGTGIGPDVASDTGGSSGDQTAAGNIRVLVNGAEVVPAYSGRSANFPGLDQTAFILPANVTPSCSVSIQIRAGGVLSNLTTIAVATGDTCTATSGGSGTTNFGLTQSQIDAIVARGSFRYGSWAQTRSVLHTIDFNGGAAPKVEGEDSVTASFASMSGRDLRPLFQQSTANVALPREGVCNYVLDSQVVPGIPALPGYTISQLDAGPSLTLSGPFGTRPLFKAPLSFSYSAKVAIAGSFLNAGRYTLSGAGGPSVGAFSAPMVMPGELVWTNRASLQTITRANGATLTWTGGQGADLVQITGLSFVFNVGAPPQVAIFTCHANPQAGSFTIPVSILNRLPASSDLGIGGLAFIYPGTLGIGTYNSSYEGAGDLDVLIRSSASMVSQSAIYK